MTDCETTPLLHESIYQIKNGESTSVGTSTTVLVASAPSLSSGSKLSKGVKRSNAADSDHVSWRVLTAYWLLGLCNNFGYVVMISAAYDILESPHANPPTPSPSNSTINSTEPVIKLRECNEISTGAILLADILPSLFAKLLSPFLPLWIHFRLGTVVILNIIGFLVVSQTPYPWVLLGVGSVSLASGLGEVTLLAYMAFFRDRNVITMWSSGTGGAGVLGSFSYALLTRFLSTGDTLLVIIVVPLTMAATFWMLMVHPKREKDVEAISKTTLGIDDVPVSYSRASFKDRLRDIPPLLRYIIPLALVYLFEYFINQGLMEMIQFENTNMTHNEQYRWFQVDYQVGVFLSRSSGSIIHIERTWILALLQGINVIYFVLEVLYRFSKYFYVVMVVVFFEGLLGGGAYVNTFFCISKKVPADKREFSMGISSMGDAIGISLAGMLAIPIHNLLCRLPYNL